MNLLDTKFLFRFPTDGTKDSLELQFDLHSLIQSYDDEEANAHLIYFILWENEEG